MYLEHYGLTEAPFRITPHTDFFFSGANRGATLEALLYAITHDEGIVKISGEVGSGKTMLCRVLMERLPSNVVIVYLANPSLSRDDILYALSDELGIELPEHSRSGIVMRALQEKLLELYATGKQVVVLIDEAHAMPMETLEEIRLLSNLESNRHKLLQLVLFGQPELDTTLRRSDMRQLRERITHNFRLEPLIREDITQYLDFRMRAAGYRGPNVFAPAAIKLIAQTSLGLTRRINILADKALLASYAAGTHQVGPKQVRAAIKDSEFSSVQPTGSGFPVGLGWAIGGALVTLAVIGVWNLLAQFKEITSTAKPADQSMAGELLAAPLSAAAPQQTSHGAGQEAQPATDSSPLVTASDKAAPPPATHPISVDKLLADSRLWLATVPDNHWFLQLYTADGRAAPELVERYLSKALKSGLEPAQLRAYRYQKGNLDRYGVIYGDYVSHSDAVTILNTLPDELKRTRPYPRQTVRLKPESNNEPSS
jgi:type II secretory pathway predicted ATPase ExeA